MDDNNIYEIYIIYALHALLLLCAYTSIYIIYINVLFLHAFYRHDGFPPPPPLHPSPRPFTSYFYIHRVRAAQRPIYRGIRRAYSCVQLPKRASGYKNNARSNHKSTPVFSSIKKGKKKKVVATVIPNLSPRDRPGPFRCSRFPGNFILIFSLPSPLRRRHSRSSVAPTCSGSS